LFDLNPYLAQKQALINGFLLNALQSEPADSRIVQAMTYSLMAGGKRLRPVLCLAASEAVGGSAESLLGVAAAIEMIHTYSLIHDDLPAMDDDRLRRGKPTCHVQFDEATAILAGDALVTLAFQMLSIVTGQTPPQRQLEVIRIVSQAAGYQGMIGGQMMDMESEGKPLTLEELKRLQAMKTGALIEASTRTGAILGGGTPDQIQRLEVYARNIGLAFQVRDDILNIEGDPEIMGKATGTDGDRKKSTFPSRIGLNESKTYAENLVHDALHALEVFDNKADPLRGIAHYIIDRKK